MRTRAIEKTGVHTWRVVDIVVAALIAIAGGVIFWAGPRVRRWSPHR
jgi:energy-coupling factor transport system substrate-specific component